MQRASNFSSVKRIHDDLNYLVGHQTNMRARVNATNLVVFGVSFFEDAGPELVASCRPHEEELVVLVHRKLVVDLHPHPLPLHNIREGSRKWKKGFV